MKIAHINMLHNGSTGKIMFNIATTAEANGHISKTYSPILFARNRKIEIPQSDNHFLWGSEFENCIHYYAGSFLGTNGMFSHKGTRSLLRELDKFKPDIIHLHNLHNFTINLSMLFKYIKKHNIKVVWTLHDCWSFTGHCPYFDMVKCEKWKTVCYKCPQKDIYPKTYLDTTKQMYHWKRNLFLGVDNLTLVTPSEWLAGLVKQSYLKNYPVKVINNGIDLSIFKPRENSIKEKYNCSDKYLLLGVAFDWGKRKGLDVFIELSKRLSDKYQIVLLGTDDNIDKQLPDNIISIHRTDNQIELAELYSAADLLVNPTREDNYPTVNMEALACGTPVVTFNTGGSPEIPDETCGRVVELDDVDSIENSIIEITENHLFSKEACLKRAESFDMYQKFSEYIDLYEQLV